MKKLKLNALSFQKGEVLTRAQLKRVLGGDDGSGGNLCDGKASTVVCKNSASEILKEISRTGCPSSAGIDTLCSPYAGYSSSKSTCTCVN